MTPEERLDKVEELAYTLKTDPSTHVAAIHLLGMANAVRKILVTARDWETYTATLAGFYPEATAYADGQECARNTDGEILLEIIEEILA